MRIGRIVLVCALAAGCAGLPPYGVERFGRGYDGIRGFRMTGNVLPSPRGSDPLVQLNAERRDVEDQGTQFSLIVELSGGEPLLIEAGEALTVTVNTEAVRLTGEGSAEQRRFSGTFQGEQAWFPTDSTLLRRIARGNAVEVRIRGSNGTATRRFGPANFQRFRAFVTQYLDSIPALRADSVSRRARPGSPPVERGNPQ